MAICLEEAKKRREKQCRREQLRVDLENEITLDVVKIWK